MILDPEQARQADEALAAANQAEWERNRALVAETFRLNEAAPPRTEEEAEREYWHLFFMKGATE